ncbi:TetR/AcrR family transcriptional regulator [Desulfurivibrio alkaliphilus]|uniref:Transcriptional regulator, TetR family n=1 Tax=Desulfurivibrio alkaliphilus (strain DSM 19089 / UNIQEM U267 / AHT2) TaxID=589865 RepID=D6Z651_DESAT|nr:TetR/AcrR family transcriptional regulator [Desulfurivibrio alkaliphilus]ADH86816.1 transcriptional regulator, TetR family [Desulfurivibrio alkaliphilus AHT 2]
MTNPGKHLPAEQRRAATVDAVLALAARLNPGKITTAAIARQMNLTQGALFRHFPNKEAIWQAVMTWVAEQLLKRVEKAARQAPGPLAGLEAMFQAHISFVVSHPGIPRMLFNELQHPGDSAAKNLARKLVERYRQRLAQLIEEGQKAGEIAPEVEAGAAAVLFVGMIQGLVVQSLLAGRPEQMQDSAPAVFALFKRGIINPQ